MEQTVTKDDIRWLHSTLSKLMEDGFGRVDKRMELTEEKLDAVASEQARQGERLAGHHDRIETLEENVFRRRRKTDWGDLPASQTGGDSGEKAVRWHDVRIVLYVVAAALAGLKFLVEPVWQLIVSRLGRP